MLKRACSVILSIAIILSLLQMNPTPANAASEAWDGAVDISWFDPDIDEFHIGTPAELAGLAALVNGMTDPNCPRVIGDESYLESIPYPDTVLVGAGGGNVSDTVYGSNLDFSYKTIYLTADIDMGGVYEDGSWSGPNWTPIGGKYPMRPEITNGDCFVLDTRFNGVLDGQGHVVNNIYCDRFAAKGFPYSMAAGLVGYLGGVKDASDGGTRVAEFDDNWQPAVKNIVLGRGSIYARRMVGGIVGRIGETSNGIIIENCANFADIRNTDSKGIGGIVGAGWGIGVIRNCYNVGSVTTTYACPAGGICGSNSGLNIYNCYNIGTIDSNNQVRGRGIGGHDTGTYTVDNCYYLEGCDDDPASNGWYTGGSRRVTVNVASRTSDEMKTQEFIDSLNIAGNVFVADSANINDGYPILFFQASGYSAPGFCNVDVHQPDNGGTISADVEGMVAFGQTVTLTANPDPGWRLRHFTLDGIALNANSITVSADSIISAVFVEVIESLVTLPDSSDCILTFTKTGYELSGSDMVYVENKLINDGDTLLEENIITINTITYPGPASDDLDMEYSGTYTITAENAERNPDGTFTITGTGPVTFTVTQNVAKKSWISLADSSWYTGASDTYTLTTARQLAGMAKLVNIEGVSFEGITLLLGNDISLKNDDGTVGERIWVACGRNTAMAFEGTFDGQGYNIYDMTAYNAGSYAGLFGFCSNAVIKNVTVRGSVLGEGSTAYAAGIAAYASATIIENCINRAIVTARGIGAGGVAAYICDGSAIIDCVNRAPVNGTTGVGGIVGIAYSGEDTVTGSFNYGEVTSLGDGSYGTGGIAGQLAGHMDGCGNFAPVTSADRNTGGLVGYASARIYSKITNSVSTGIVSSNSLNQLASIGAAVGYAQYLEYENISSTGSVTTGGAFISSSIGGLIGREGSVTVLEESEEIPLPSPTDDDDSWTHPPISEAPWSITFIADDVVIDTQTYASSSDTILLPSIPSKPGYIVSWASYSLGTCDIIIQAVYRPIIVRSGDIITTNGTFFIDPYALGDISIADDLAVVLDGSFGQSVGLSITTGNNISLTLANVRLSGSSTLLSLVSGDLAIIGSNEIFGSCDVRGNENPTVSISGDVIVSGTGRLSITAEAGNVAIKLDQGASFEMHSGTLSLHKEGLLGEEGGALYANDATVIISGGTVYGYTNSDNVSVISAGVIAISGGVIRAQALLSPYAIEGATIMITGCSLYCYGHTGNSHQYSSAYYGTDAVDLLSYPMNGVFEDVMPFDDVLVTDPHFEAMYLAYNAGYFTGITDTEFAPTSSMNRAMFVTVLHRIADLPSVDLETSSNSFTDVPHNEWYSIAVAWAVENGITTGTSDTTFSPDDIVTVEQLALFICRYAASQGMAVTPTNGDYGAGASSWARAAVVWAVENGILAQGSDWTGNADRALLASAVIAFELLG